MTGEGREGWGKKGKEKGGERQIGNGRERKGDEVFQLKFLAMPLTKTHDLQADKTCIQSNQTSSHISDGYDNHICPHVNGLNAKAKQ